MAREHVEAVRAVYEKWAKGDFRAGSELWDQRVLFVPGDFLTHAEALAAVGLSEDRR